METCQGGRGQAGEVDVGWSWVVGSELGRPALDCCPSEPLWILS